MAEAEHYEQDSLLRFKATFKNIAGTATDPTVVTLRITKPGLAAVTYTYGTDAELERDSVGIYHMDFTCDVAGEYKYRWKGTGAVQIALKGGFIVDPE